MKKKTTLELSIKSPCLHPVRAWHLEHQGQSLSSRVWCPDSNAFPGVTTKPCMGPYEEPFRDLSEIFHHRLEWVALRDLPWHLPLQPGEILPGKVPLQIHYEISLEVVPHAESQIEFECSKLFTLVNGP